MKIVRIETIPVSVPIDPSRAVIGARGLHDHSPFLIVRLHTNEGLEGLGEVSCTPGWSGEDSVTARHVIEKYLAPRLVDKDPRQIERLVEVMDTVVFGHRFTKAGVEMAAWDLLGKASGLPVHKLLGGPIRERIPTKFSVAGVESERAAEIAVWAHEQGFHAMKVKVGRGLKEDILRVRAVRDAIGNDVLLGVDANCGWTRAEATAAIAPLEEINVGFIEQPVAARDLEGLAHIRNRSAVPVVADESVGTPEEALDVVRASAADVLSIYVGMAGGISSARRVAAVGDAARLTWTIGSNLELGIGMAAHLHLAAATPGLAGDAVPCDIISNFYYVDDLLTEPLAIHAGWAEPPMGHGLGVELDEKKLERYREEP